MLLKSVRAALFPVVAACVALGFMALVAQAQDPASETWPPVVRERTIAGYDLVSLAANIVYSQPPSLTGTLLQSSWWDPNGSDYDQYVWDNFTLPSSEAITEIRWRGGYDPAKFGSGGAVISFTVAIYASIPGGTQPDVISLPLWHYQTGNAAETPAGMSGGVTMYDYILTLPTPFQAAAGTKYWLQIEAFQHGIPDWGIATGTGGDGQYFRRIANVGDIFYQTMTGDAAFTLLALPTTAHRVDLPFVHR